MANLKAEYQTQTFILQTEVRKSFETSKQYAVLSEVDTNTKSNGWSCIAGSQKIANELNKLFCEIGPKLCGEIPQNDIDPLQYLPPCNSFRQVTDTELVKVLQSLKPSKASGLDKITNTQLKAAEYTINETLLYIFNLVLATGIFPDDFKIAKVTPIYKDGDKCESENSRSISLLPLVAKILKNFIYDQLNKYLIENDIVVEQQSGFCKSHSTETCLLQSTNAWLKNIDKGIINGVLFLDLKKAFDTVDHQIFLSEFEIYGIRNQALRLFKSYLDNRMQICVLQGIKSETKKLHVVFHKDQI